jgi:hypothetical protein
MRWQGTKRGGVVQRIRSNLSQPDVHEPESVSERNRIMARAWTGLRLQSFRTACVDAGFLSLVNEPSSYCAILFHSSVAGCSRWVTGACCEKSSVKLWSNSAEHECLSEVLQVARWLKCGRFTVVHHLAVRVGVEPPQTPDAQSTRTAHTQRMSDLSNGAAC